jgi:hypothetical protein
LRRGYAPALVDVVLDDTEQPPAPQPARPPATAAREADARARLMAGGDVNVLDAIRALAT